MDNQARSAPASSVGKKHEVSQNKRSKRVIILVVLALLSLPVLWLGSRMYQIQRMVGLLREAGKPVTLREIEFPQVPDDRNAAFFLSECNDPLQQLLSTFFESTGGTPWTGVPSESTNQFESLESQFPTVFPTLAKACGCEVWRDPGERSFLDWSDPKREVSQLRSAATVIDWKIQALVDRGQGEEAVQWATHLFELMNLYSDAPRTNMGHLNLNAMRQVGVKAAIFILESDLPVAPENLKRLLSQVRQQDRSTHYEKALETERAFGLDLLRQNNSAYYVSGSVYLAQMNRELESAKNGTPQGPLNSPVLPFDRRVDASPALAMVRNTEDRTRAALQGLIELLEEAANTQSPTD